MPMQVARDLLDVLLLRCVPILLTTSHPPPVPQRNVSIADVRGAVRTSKTFVLDITLVGKIIADYTKKKKKTKKIERISQLLCRNVIVKRLLNPKQRGYWI